MADKYFITKTGTKRMRQTTQGWKFLVQWANETCQWIDLKILKESNIFGTTPKTARANLQGRNTTNSFVVC
jgi:hypothetical protein